MLLPSHSQAQNAASGKVIMGLDVWEHAYYLDYQNRRIDFVETVLDNLADWDSVASRMGK